MAEPISLVSGLVALVTAGVQASNSLYATIQSYKTHPKFVRDLQDELEALNSVLQVLGETVNDSTTGDFASLELPLRRCKNACKEFEETLLKCTERNGGSRSKFRAWLQVRYMDSDINGFKDALSGYKSTISIAIAGANLRATKVSLNAIHEYDEMIKNTTIDLEEHLRDMNEKLETLSLKQSQQDGSADQLYIQAERDSTLQCLQICTQVSKYIEQHQSNVMEDVYTPPDAIHRAGFERGSGSPRRVIASTLHECNEKIKLTNLELSSRLQHLSSRLSSIPRNPSGPSPRQAVEQDKVLEELESIRQCLDICGKAVGKAEEARVNVMADVAVADDAQQWLVSTIGELIDARRVTAGARSLQCIGQLSDDSLQQVSRGHSSFSAELNTQQAKSGSEPESQYGVGRTLGRAMSEAAQTSNRKEQR